MKAPLAKVPFEAEITKTFKVGGEPREIHMSYGLLTILARGVGDAVGATTLLSDHDLRDWVLVETLSPRDKKGRIAEDTEFSLFESNISTEEAEAICNWVSDHLLPFFLKGAEKSTELAVRHQDELAALKSRASTLTGSGNSASETPSA